MNRYSYDRRKVVAISFYGLQGVREALLPHDQEEDLRTVIQGIRTFSKEAKTLVGMYEEIGKKLESEFFHHQAQLLTHRLKEMEEVLPKMEELLHLLKGFGEAVMKYIHENPTAGAHEVSQLPIYRKYLEIAKPLVPILDSWEEGGDIPSGTEVEDIITGDCKIASKFESVIKETSPIDDGLLPGSIFGFMYLISDTDSIVKLRTKHQV